MLPRDSFFRNAPRVFDLNTRLKWEVIVNASDSVGLAHFRLLQTLEKFNSANPLDDDAETYRSLISVDCWSVVDHTHALFQILKLFPHQPEGQLDGFLRRFESTIFKMRNSRSHIGKNINNISKNRATKHPMYGALAFTTPLRDDLTYDAVTFALGGFQFDEQVGCGIDTYASPLRNAFGNVTFCAFGETLNISSLCALMEAVLVSMDESARAQTLPRLREFSEKNGLDYERLLRESIKGTVIARFHIKLDVF